MERLAMTMVKFMLRSIAKIFVSQSPAPKPTLFIHGGERRFDGGIDSRGRP
ncbi:membrane-bound O-acyltransferase family protein [Sesbania bispinosa]|nr:membrane-bound O-acyltransferase family protein [Sesbania bispinosa]